MTSTTERTVTTDERLARRAALADPLDRWRRMVEIRAVETSVQALYNDGHVRGSTHLCSGQEAVSVGLAAAIRPTDVVTCTYRGHGAALALGVTPEQVLGEICGRSVGCAGGLGGSMHLSGVDVGLFPTFAIVGAGLPVAVGAALSASVRETDDVAVAVCGDGATNIGAFHESLNLAAAWRLPVVFLVENNLYGEYSPLSTTTPVSDLAVRAAAYAMEAAIVDGQDVDAVQETVGAAADRARSGGGPTLIEAKTYRYSGHSRSDPATYRPEGELDSWLARDPIDIASRVLVDAGRADADLLLSMRSDVEEDVALAVGRVIESAEPGLEEIFAHVWAERS